MFFKNQSWQTMFKNMNVWSKTKLLAGEWQRSEMTLQWSEMSVGWGLCRKSHRISHCSPNSLNCMRSLHKIWHLHPTTNNTPKTSKKMETFLMNFASFKDNSQYVQRGRALVCHVKKPSAMILDWELNIQSQINNAHKGCLQCVTTPHHTLHKRFT